MKNRPVGAEQNCTGLPHFWSSPVPINRATLFKEGWKNLELWRGFPLSWEWHELLCRCVLSWVTSIFSLSCSRKRASTIRKKESNHGWWACRLNHIPFQIQSTLNIVVIG